MRKLKHGAYLDPEKLREYRRWQAMIARCYRPRSTSYARYGGRGITVCERWQKFENFFADMGLCPAGHSLDRIDNDGLYDPANCRWATRAQQVNNRRETVMLTFQGRTLPLSDWSRITGKKAKLIWERLNKRGWSVDEALTK